MCSRDSDAANRFLAKPLSASDVVSSYAGVRPLYDDGSANPSQVTRDYVIKRERHAVNGALDYRINPDNALIFRGIVNKFKDYEINNRPEFQVADDRIERVLKNRQQLAFAQENLQAHQRTFVQIRLRSDQGVGRRADLDQEDARAALAVANLQSAESALRES